MKKLVSLLMALAMVFGLAVPVMAAEADPNYFKRVQVTTDAIGYEAIEADGFDVIDTNYDGDIYYVDILVYSEDETNYLDAKYDMVITSDDPSADVEWRGYAQEGASAFNLKARTLTASAEPITGIGGGGNDANNPYIHPLEKVDPNGMFDPTGVAFDEYYGFPQRLGYRTVSEYYAEMNYLAATYPELCKLHTVIDPLTGETCVSWQGVPMVFMEICNAPGVQDGRPGTLHIAGTHPREWPSNELCMNVAWYLITNYGKDTEIGKQVTEVLDTIRVWLLPQHNPDGVHYDQTHGSGRQRKNLRPADPTLPVLDENGNVNSNYRGTDLNRNWPYRWGSSDGSNDKDVVSETTNRGASPNGDPENRAVAAIVSSNQIMTDIAGHTFGGMVIYPWSNKKGLAVTDNMNFEELGRQLADYNLYHNFYERVIYSQSGEGQEYLYGAFRSLGFTFEMGFNYGGNSAVHFIPPYDGELMYLAYAPFNDKNPHMGQRKIPLRYKTGNAPTEDVTAPVAFLVHEDGFVTGSTKNVYYSTAAWLQEKLDADPNYVKGKILMAMRSQSGAEEFNVVKLAQDNGAVGVFFAGMMAENTNSNHTIYLPTYTDNAGAITIPVAGSVRSYAREFHEKVTAGEVENTLTFKATQEKFNTQYLEWERNLGAYHLLFDWAVEYAGQIRGTITDGNGNLKQNAALDLELEVHSTLMVENERDVIDWDNTYDEMHTSHYDVVGGNYNWYVVPSVQFDTYDYEGVMQPYVENPRVGTIAVRGTAGGFETDDPNDPKIGSLLYPNDGYTVTASANGAYSDTKQVVVEDYKVIVEDVNFVVPTAIDSTFNFTANIDLNGEVVVPFTTYNKAGEAVDVTGATATVNGVAATIASLGNGQYTATFVPAACGVATIDALEIVIDFASDDAKSALVLSAAAQGGIELTTDAHLVQAGDEVALNTAFNPEADSNTAILTYSYDSNLFNYTDFTAAEGVSVVDTKEADGQVIVTVMKQDYAMSEIGALVLTAKEDAEVAGGATVAMVEAEFVVKNGDEKVINTAFASVSFLTGAVVEGDTDFDGDVDIIDLSNLIDWFGTTDAAADWNALYIYFDFNNNGRIDIYDISYVAQKLA